MVFITHLYYYVNFEGEGEEGNWKKVSTEREAHVWQKIKSMSSWLLVDYMNKYNNDEWVAEPRITCMNSHCINLYLEHAGVLMPLLLPATILKKTRAHQC